VSSDYELYANGLRVMEPKTPAAVVFPDTAAQVQAAVLCATKHGAHPVPRSGGCATARRQAPCPAGPPGAAWQMPRVQEATQGCESTAAALSVICCDLSRAAQTLDPARCMRKRAQHKLFAIADSGCARCPATYGSPAQRASPRPPSPAASALQVQL
jgi:hypothetical protein